MKSLAKNIRVSPRKVRLLAKELIGQRAVEVLEKLEFVNKAARPPLLSAIKSAVANAVNNAHAAAEKLVIRRVIVDEGMKMKRAAKGRNARTDRGIVQKRTSHVRVILEEESEIQSPKSET
jgi:large subunit ribosomal protein L22